jgi:N-acetylmuramoyl-L-alanine amidase
VTTRTKARRPRAALAILAAGIAVTTACAGCQSQVTGTPSALAAGGGSPVDGGTATATAAASASGSGAASASATAVASASGPAFGAKAPSPQPSPAGAAATASPASRLAGKVVAIDPGHNGGNAAHAGEIAELVPQGFGQYKACDTTGTEAPDGYPEHQFNFQVSQLVKSMLEQQGITVVMTRTNDTSVGPCVNVRAALGNKAHADAAVSIHADGGPTGGRGYQLLEADQSAGGSGIDAASHLLEVALHKSFDAESGLMPSTYVGTDGYEPRDDLAGLNLSTVPKILVECGNMQNSDDLAIEESAAGRQHIAKAIVDGIVAYLSAGS